MTTATLAPAFGERRKDRAGAQVLGVVHHHFGARLRRPRNSCRRCRAPTAGTPVTIDRLFGLVNDGTTLSAVRQVPRPSSEAIHGARPASIAWLT